MAVANQLSAQDAAEKAVSWISDYFQSMGESVSVELINADETDSGLYQFTIEITSSQGSQNETYFVSKDGTFFIPQVIDISETSETPTTTVPAATKSDRPEAHAFIMSYCPYGLQFLKAYIPVIELLGDKADLEVNFVHYLMHGEQEMIENTRMYCIQKEQSDKFTDYLRCFVESGDAENCTESVGIDADALESCMEAADDAFQITKSFEESTSSYPPYLVDAALSQQYGVGGSPTFVLNGETISVNRSPEAIKQAICAAFNEPPEECNQALSTAAEAPSFGPLGSGSGSSSTGQC
jgi:protein-disulfide isomerase